jgi:hypothetical protein
MRRIGILMGFIAGIALLAGCSKNLDAYVQDCMTIQKDGTIQDVSVEDFSDGNYDMSNLEQFITEEITNYNTEAGSEHIILEQLETENKLAKLELSYDEMEDYNSFNNTDYVLASLADSNLSGSMTAVSDGSSVSAADIEDKEYQVLQITDAVRVAFQGKVLYYNSAVTVEDDVFLTSGEGIAIIVFK